MKTKIVYLAILPFIFRCGIINETRKSAGIAKQQLFLNEKDGKIEFQPTLFLSHYDANQRAGLYLVIPKHDGKYDIRVISENPPERE